MTADVLVLWVVLVLAATRIITETILRTRNRHH